MKDSQNFLNELFSEHYERNWTPEREYRLTDSQFAAAIVDLRQRTRLTQSQFTASTPGSAIAFSNLKNLETKGRPITADVCLALKAMAIDYRLPKLADFFDSAARHSRHRQGRPKARLE